MEEKTIRRVMHDRSYTYSYRTTRSYMDESSKSLIIGNHMHIYYEFLQLIDGRMLYNVEGHEYEANPGDLLITNPYEFHFFSFPKKSVYVRQFLQISSSFVNTLYPHLLDTLDNRPFGENNRISADIVKKYRLDDIFLTIEEASANVTEYTDFMVRTAAAQLVVKLSEILQKEFLINGSFSDNKHLKKIENYIENNFSGDINLDKIASHMFLNKSYVSRIFKAETGMTVNSYINMRRTVQAKNLLLSGMTPGDIYYQCGFKDYTTFYRSFKKYIGFSPDEFRRKTK